MLLGVFGDIHGNIEALASVYARLTGLGCEQIVCLGDIVGYGASPGECINFLKDNEIACIKGNHDFFTLDRQEQSDWNMKDYSREAIIWTQKQLTEQQFHWLENLPFSMKIAGVQFVHSSMETLDGEYWPYILDAKTAQFHFYLQECQVAFCGHIHIPLLFTCSENHGIRVEMLKPAVLDLQSDNKYLINPGAVGQPRDLDWRASSVTYDTETGQLTPLRAEYDVAATQKKIIVAGLAEDLADRLSNGT
ncbi:MAG: metallophosphoesterase family protein [Victivallaceae bacterium]|nr:metallophosphoesterase family protein [Victivallaceae bacterium]